MQLFFHPEFEMIQALTLLGLKQYALFVDWKARNTS
jgi:hypothetical protein